MDTTGCQIPVKMLPKYMVKMVHLRLVAWNTTWNDAETLAQDQERWRSFAARYAT